MTEIAVIGVKTAEKRTAVERLKAHLIDIGADAHLTVPEPCPTALTVNERDFYDGVFSVGEDEALLRPWIGAAHLRVADSPERLIAECDRLLGYPEPREVERKYLIKMPDLHFLESLPLCRKVDITQAYIITPEGRARIRARGEGGQTQYFKTVKRTISALTRVEEEHRLTKQEFDDLMLFADKKRKAIVKSRHCLLWNATYFELDVFDFWKTQAFLEVELLDESDEVRLPDFIEVIRDVSGDDRYRNSALAKEIPAEG